MFRSASQTLLRWIVLLVLIPGLATGCFEIEEIISLNRDGSGSYTMRVDMSEAMGMIQAMGGGESGEVSKASASMDSTMVAAVTRLESIKGISNVKQSSENFMLELSYDFTDVDALNQASSQNELNSSAGMSGSPLEGVSYAWTPKSFIRSNPPLGETLDTEDPEMEQTMAMMRMMMGEASFTSKYSFPGKVKKVENELAEVQEDKKTVLLVVPLLDYMDGKASLSNNIRFKKR